MAGGANGQCQWPRLRVVSGIDVVLEITARNACDNKARWRNEVEGERGRDRAKLQLKEEVDLVDQSRRCGRVPFELESSASYLAAPVTSKLLG